ncbi:hypothetical protein J3A83DRAFT_4384623 [Scleroderma citrinum]
MPLLLIVLYCAIFAITSSTIDITPLLALDITRDDSRLVTFVWVLKTRPLDLGSSDSILSLSAIFASFMTFSAPVHPLDALTQLPSPFNSSTRPLAPLAPSDVLVLSVTLSTLVCSFGALA